MAEVVLFHHALGLTDGVVAFADRLRAAGHTVHTPDLFGGATFTDLDEAVAHADALGSDELVARATAAVDELADAVVYGGFSLGVVPAQHLAQNRAGARAALLYHEGMPPRWFGSAWPDAVALQVHVSEHDPWVELDAARGLVEGARDAELFVYPGAAHLFTDATTAEHDAGATEQVIERSLHLLERSG